MKTKEHVIKTYVADDGTSFNRKNDCEKYELRVAKKKVGESSK